MFARLDGFMTGYLHQDWDVEYDSAEAAARDFAANSEIERVAEVIGEIAVLSNGDGEQRVSELWRERSWDYYPGEGCYAEFLRSLGGWMSTVAADRLDESRS